MTKCDLCTIVGNKCPGQEAHCKKDEHCVLTTEVCALDAKYLDHKIKCCDCSEDIAWMMK